MQEFEFGNCGNCAEAVAAADLFKDAWQQFAADENYPSADDRARIREHFVRASREGRQIPKPGGGFYESADEHELTVVEAFIINNGEYGATLTSRAERLQRIFRFCRGRMLGHMVTVEDRLCPTTICSSLAEISGIRHEFSNPSSPA